MADSIPELKAPQRILMGPGPSEMPYSVQQALTQPMVGHLDPYFLATMDAVQDMLRQVYQTKNQMTIPMSGTGTAGMETCLVNLIEPGDKVVVGVIGYFGDRLVQIAERCGAEVVKVEATWGQILPEKEFAETVAREKPKVVAFVHAETTTGVLQPVEPVMEAARKVGAYTVIDCVTSLGGLPVKIDEWGIDAAYSGIQKCLGGPPGLAPVTFSERAMERIRKRKTKAHSWYLDVSLMGQYWGAERTYHHTAPIVMNYALYESLRQVLTEGLEARFARHRRNHEALVAGLDAMGLTLASQEGHRLPMLNAVAVPEGVDEPTVRKRLLEDHNLEVGAGMGQFKGKIWRVGIMGASSQPNYIVLYLAAMEKILRDLKFKVAGSGAAAALDYYKTH